MVNEYLTKGARAYKGVKVASSINGIERFGQALAQNK